MGQTVNDIRQGNQQFNAPIALIISLLIVLYTTLVYTYKSLNYYIKLLYTSLHDMLDDNPLMTNLSTLLTNGILTNHVTHDNLNSDTSTKSQQGMPQTYNVDSYLIGIDNHASASMSNNPNDFIGTLQNSNNTISGIKGHLNTVKIGTVRWHIQDDDGKAHRFDLPNTYLVPDLPIRLLSPQHLAREMTQKHGDVDHTVCITYADRVVLS